MHGELQRRDDLKPPSKAKVETLLKATKLLNKKEAELREDHPKKWK
jgi:hypothetical protein